MRGRNLTKRLVYRSGLLSAWHYVRNRSHLTIVLFHRVLPAGSAEWLEAEEQYALTADAFSDCLAFFKRHYNVVDLKDVINARHGGPPLPPRPMLITLDDGWSDTLRVAAPILKRHGLPAVCFAVSEVLDQADPRWWQNTFALYWARVRAQPGAARRNCSSLSNLVSQRTAKGYHDALREVADLTQLERRHLLESESSSHGMSDGTRHMLTAKELPELLDYGIAVGAHGSTHVPLLICRDPRAELNDCRLRLNEILQHSGEEVVAFAFPHGLLNEEVAALARECGYKILFSSTAALAPLTRGRLLTDVCGRVSIQASHILDRQGRFRPELLALHLFPRAPSAPG